MFRAEYPSVVAPAGLVASGSREGVRASVSHGVIVPAATLDLPNWLLAPHSGVESVLFEWLPEEVRVEETFSNVNADSTIKLGHARGVILVGQSSCRAG